MMKAPIRIVMVDDHLVVRDGLKSFLELGGQVTVVGTAATAEDALDVVADNPCDLVLLDLELPANNGIWCARRLKERHARLPVIILTMHTDEGLVIEAVQAGASGYVIKSASGDEVLRAVKEVFGGKTYIDPRVAGCLLTRIRKRPEVAEPAQPQNLSPREREILSLAGRGMNNKEIAEELTLTQNTIKTHLRSIYRKCGVPDRVQAVLFALRHGI